MPAVPTPADPDAANRAWWDGVAAEHRTSVAGYYDPAPLVAGGSSFRRAEEAALAAAFPEGVAGKDVLHLQCHLALDSITLARRGARVTGVDFSAEALQGAGELAARCGVPLTLVQSDATRLPATLHGRFDLVWATIGVITWHADLLAWMASAAAALRPGGRLVLLDLHPLFCMPATVTPLVMDFPYAFDGAHAFDEPGSYANPAAKLTSTVSVSYAHSLGAVVNAAIAAGLRVERLDELLEADFDPRPTLLTREPDGRYRWRLGAGADGAEADGAEAPPLPVLFVLVAGKVG